MGPTLAALLLAAVPQDAIRIEARFVDQAGEALPGVTLLASRLPQVRPAVSDEHGHVALELPSHLGQSLILSTEHPDLPGRTWIYHDPESDAVHDLGTLVLPPGGTLLGRVVDGEGDRVGGRWRVSARAQPESKVGERLTAAGLPLFAEVDPSSGEFRIERVPVGTVNLSARHPGLRVASSDVQVEIEPGAETFVEVEYHGPDPTRCVRVDLDLVGPAPPTMAPVLVTVRDVEGTETVHPVNLRRNGSQRVFVDAGRGPFTVTLDDSRFEPHDRQVDGGETCDLTLVGSCTYQLELVDAESGQRLPRAGLTLVRARDRTTILPAGTALRAPHPLRGFFPGEKLTVELDLPGRSPLTLTPPAARKGDVRWRVAVDPPRTLALELVDAQGAPCAGARVEVTEGPLAGTLGSAHKVNGQWVPLIDHVAVSDERGRVAVLGLHPSEYTYRVFFGPCLVHEDTRVPDDRLQRVIEPAHGTVDLEVLLPERAAAAVREDRLQLRVHPHGKLQSAGVARFSLDGEDLRVKLPPGKAAVYGSLATPTGRRARTWKLTDCEVRAGVTSPLELDLRETCLGTVRVDVRLEGRVTTGRFDGVVLVHYPGQDDPVVFDQLVSPQFHGAHAPGDYHVSLQANDGAWSIDERFTLLPAGHVERERTFTVLWRTLELIDGETGTPLADQSFSLQRTRHGLTWDQEATTDRDGRVRLRMVEGEARLQVENFVSTTIEVTAGSEALAVRLQR